MTLDWALWPLIIEAGPVLPPDETVAYHMAAVTYGIDEFGLLVGERLLPAFRALADAYRDMWEAAP